MKRAGNIMMILLLLIATGGLSITRHYCGRSIISVSLFSTPKPCCGSDCDKCHNESSFNKVTDNFTVSNNDVGTSVIISNPVQNIFIIEIFSSLPATPMAANITPRKFLYQKPGDFPVSFGNFRCWYPFSGGWVPIIFLIACLNNNWACITYNSLPNSISAFISRNFL